MVIKIYKNEKIYKKAFEDITKSVDNWTAETLYDENTSKKDLLVALAYIVATVDTYSEVIRNWSDEE